MGAVIDAAVSAGGDVLSFGGIRFLVSNQPELEDQARLSAIDEALRKAEAMAERAWVSLGNIVRIEELSFGTPIPVALEEDAGIAAPTPVFPGSQEIRATVLIQFAIS